MIQALYVGLMSGTSIDAINAVLLEHDEGASAVIASTTYPIPDDIRQRSLAITQGRAAPDRGELDELEVAFGRVFAGAVNQLFDEHDVDPARIAAVGSPG